MTRYKLGVVVMAGVLVSSVLSAIDPIIAAAAPPAPDPTLSLYVTSASNNQLRAWGEETADNQRSGLVDVDAFVVLHFFAAIKFSAASFGATRLGGPDQTTSQIRTAAQRYGECWFNGNPGGGRTLKLALGVTNDLLQSSWAGAHGEAWANMVTNANDWASTNGYAAKLSFNGAIDAEDTFGTAPPAKNWANGYRNASSPWNYFYYGDAEGCPSDKNPGGRAAGIATTSCMSLGNSG
jgi:hypothetical protein